MCLLVVDNGLEFQICRDASVLNRALEARSHFLGKQNESFTKWMDSINTSLNRLEHFNISDGRLFHPEFHPGFVPSVHGIGSGVSVALTRIKHLQKMNEYTI